MERGRACQREGQQEGGKGALRFLGVEWGVGVVPRSNKRNSLFELTVRGIIQELSQEEIKVPDK